MPKKKHDWNQLKNYLDVHDGVLTNKKYSSYFQNTPAWKHKSFTKYYLRIETTILFDDGIRLEVKKDVEVAYGGPKPVARTYTYTYAAFDGSGPIFRYCSPHPDHRPFHHKHVYNPTTREELKHSPEKIGKDSFPHLSEVIEEIISMIAGTA